MFSQLYSIIPCCCNKRYHGAFSPGRNLIQRWSSFFCGVRVRGRKKSHTYFMWVNKQGTKQSHNYYKLYTEPMHWWLYKSYYRNVKQSEPEENITPSVFSLGILQSRSQRFTNQKVAQKKVQVRGKLAEIVSISPTGFERFKCGTRLAGRSEILGNYRQRDPRSKWEYKSTSIKPTFYTCNVCELE